MFRGTLRTVRLVSRPYVLFEVFKKNFILSTHPPSLPNQILRLLKCSLSSPNSKQNLHAYEIILNQDKH